MNQIFYTEQFLSHQGEARWCGVPSVFLRTFGCNFRCRDFGCKKPNSGTHNPEVLEIIKNIKQYNSFDDLPLVKTGCDSYPSVYPEFRKLAQRATPQELSKSLLATAGGSWVKESGNDVHLVLTGGEPLLGWQVLYPELFMLLESQGIRNITFETNGTQPLTTGVCDFIRESSIAFTFIVSPKLSASGESREDAIKPQVVCDYELHGFTYLKFVVENEKHFDEVDSAVRDYREQGFQGQVYVMPVGGVSGVYKKNAQRVAEMALTRGYCYSPRLHVDLWGNGWGK